MSERKVLNKYYPPDFDPSKIPRAKCPKNRQFTVRLMAPCNMKCLTCGEYIAKAKKFNARKEDVENLSYLGIRIYRFYIKCPGCLAEISFRTDPESTDYVIEAGAHRNFQALKLAEEQAAREDREAKEEIESNPMLLLENRTQQSQHEMEILESLEDLRELNERHAGVDLESMTKKYEEDRMLTKEQQEELEKLAALKALGYEVIDGRLIKRIAPESLEEERSSKKPKNSSGESVKPTDFLTNVSSVNNKHSSMKSKLAGLVRVLKKSENSTKNECNSESSTNSESKSGTDEVYAKKLNSNDENKITKSQNVVEKCENASKSDTAGLTQNSKIKATTGLGLLGSYSDSDSSSED